MTQSVGGDSLLCWVLLCWVLLCWVLLCWVLLCWVLLPAEQGGDLCMNARRCRNQDLRRAHVRLNANAGIRPECLLKTLRFRQKLVSLNGIRSSANVS